jgi:hypothetical protein
MINVDDAEIDAIIAKIDDALAKSSQLTGQANHAETLSLEASLGVRKRSEGDFAAFWVMTDKQVSTTKKAMEKVLVEEAAKTAKQTAEIKMSLKRVATMINPMLSQVGNMEERINTVKKYGLQSIGGVVGVVYMAYTLYRQLDALIKEEERKREEYRRDIMQMQKLTRQDEYERFQQQMQATADAYKRGVIP